MTKCAYIAWTLLGLLLFVPLVGCVESPAPSTKESDELRATLVAELDDDQEAEETAPVATAESAAENPAATPTKEDQVAVADSRQDGIDNAQADAAEATSDPNWGTLRGRFLYDGEVPAPRKIKIGGNQPFCAKFPLVSEELVVGEEGELANVFVTLYAKKQKPEIHDSYDKSAQDTIRLDNQNCRFEPHCLFVRTGQTLEIHNLDTDGHNAKLALFSNAGGDTGVIPGGAFSSLTFKKTEMVPAKTVCNIHPWMVAHVAIVDHPYALFSKADGTFEIPNLPVGTWKFRLWHESTGYVKVATRDGKQEDVKRGIIELTITAGENNLGDILLPL